MELDAPRAFTIDAEGCCLYILGAGDDSEAFGKGRDGVSVRHPYDTSRTNSFEEFVILVTQGEVCTTILTAIARLYLTSCLVDEALCSIAYTQYRKTPTQGG